MGGDGWGANEIVPGEVHFRLRHLLFFFQKAAIVAEERRYTVFGVPRGSTSGFGPRTAAPGEGWVDLPKSGVGGVGLVEEQWLWDQQYYAIQKKTHEPSSVRSSDGVPLEVHIPAVRLNDEVQTGQGDNNANRKNALYAW